MGKRVGLLAGLLVLSLASGTVAQSPSPEPPPWFGGQRVALPEYRVVVTVPEGAAMWDMTGDVDEQLRTVAAEQGLEASDDDIAAWAEVMRQRVPGQLAFIASARSTCGITVGTGMGADLDAVAEAFYVRQSGDESVTHVERPEVLDLPMGRVHRVTFGKLGEEAAIYLGEAMDLVFNLWCAGPERPADDWLSIAESFEFLPEAE